MALPPSLDLKQGDDGKWTGSVSHGGTDPPLQGATALDIYARLVATSTNKIDGKSVIMLDQAASPSPIEFDPAPADVDTPGTYRVYVRATYADGKTARFPGGKDYLKFTLSSNFE